MRVHAEKYGRLHVNVFHNRIQFFMRDGRRWLSVFYYYNQAGDYTQSARTIPRETVRAIFRRAFASKRFSADKGRWIPDEVLVWLETKWGSGSLKGRPKKRAKPQLIHVINPATATEIRRTLGITEVETRNVLRAFHAAGIKMEVGEKLREAAPVQRLK